MPGSLSHKLIARSDVSLYDLLQVLEKLLVSDLQLRANSGAGCLLKLLDINVDDVVGEELPGEGDVVRALGGGAEHKLTKLEVLQNFSRLQGVDVLELGVVDASHVELLLALSTAILVHFECLVDEVFRVIVDALGNEVAVMLKVNSFAGQ